MYHKHIFLYPEPTVYFLSDFLCFIVFSYFADIRGSDVIATAGLVRHWNKDASQRLLTLPLSFL